VSSSLPPIARSLVTTTRELEGAVLLIVVGELDLATAPELCRDLDSACQESSRIVVDLRGVTLCDTACVRALVGAAQEAAIRMCQLVFVVEPQSTLDRSLDASGAGELVSVENGVRRALATFDLSFSGRAGHRGRGRTA
jgi:anti-anti-sigma factor